MGNSLKALIAATCLVIIAGVSFFVWVEVQKRPSETDKAFQRHDDLMRRLQRTD